MASETILVAPTLSVEGRPLRVLSYLIEESLSTVPLLECEVVENMTDSPDPSELIGKQAELVLEKTDGSAKRSFVGAVVAAERAPDQDDVASVRLQIAPAMWRLGKRADCRIFQEKTAVDIVTEVLAAAGVNDVEWRVAETPPTRVYTVQYRETDLAFVLRLMAEEGIYFAVHAKDGKDLAIFCDDPLGLGDAEDGPTTLGYLPEFGGAQASDTLFHVEQAHEVVSDKVFVRDYDPERPKLKLESTVESADAGEHVLEVYEYPGRFVEAPVADRYAKALLDSMQARRNVVSGATGALHLMAGHRFTIEDHPYEPLNQEVLVTSIRIEGCVPRLGEQSRAAGGGRAHKYECTFRAVPTSTTRFRPERRERAATIPGLQTAFTTGPAGEEVHTDKHGNVKAWFHWDRVGQKDDHSSRWMRTSQVPTGGSMLLPRMGWEVTVCHLEGDSDRPYVMGRVYNAVTAPPYALPENKAKSSMQTATTPGGGSSNELRMSDTAGSEQMFFNASKDMTIDVKNNVTESVGNDSNKKVGANQKKNVTNSVNSSIGADQTLDVGGNQSVKTETFMVDQIGGDHSLDIGGNRTMMIGGDHKRDVAGSSTLDVGGNQIDLVVGVVSEDTLANHEHAVGAALVELTAGDRSLLIGGNSSEATGAAKIIVVKGGRGVEVGGTMMQKVAGAIINVASGDINESSAGTYTEIAAGASIVKAANVAFEAENMLTLVMGASTITMMPAVIAVAGVSLKLDGATADVGAMILDN